MDNLILETECTEDTGIFMTGISWKKTYKMTVVYEF